MRRALVPALLLLTGCGSQPPAGDAATSGARLETAAVQAGIVTDPARASIVGSWALDTDRVCVVPADSGTYRLGALIDYGDGQGCAAAGTATRRGDTVAVRFGACRFDAAFDGTRIAFPPELPAACDRLCTGRASLAALSVEHLSASVSEAETLRAPSGKTLCSTGQ